MLLYEIYLQPRVGVVDQQYEHERDHEDELGGRMALTRIAMVATIRVRFTQNSVGRVKSSPLSGIWLEGTGRLPESPAAPPDTSTLPPSASPASRTFSLRPR